ncbi:MAG: tetratricopeptide repeat protein, partial [Myxococcota bacterium]
MSHSILARLGKTFLFFLCLLAAPLRAAQVGDEKDNHYTVSNPLVMREVLEERHQDTADSYNNLGNAYYKKGDYDQAITNFKEALVIRRQVLGDQHEKTADSYHNLGFAYGSKDSHDQAITNFKEALVIRRQVLGDQHEK